MALTVPENFIKNYFLRKQSALSQNQRQEAVSKIRGSHSSSIFPTNLQKIFLKISKKISRFFSKIFKIRKFQMTESDLKWISYESLQHFKTFGQKINLIWQKISAITRTFGNIWEQEIVQLKIVILPWLNSVISAHSTILGLPLHYYLKITIN